MATHWHLRTDSRVKQILDPNQIREGVCQLAEQVKAIYEGRPITIVAILTGSLVLLADLIRQLEMPLRVALIQASRLRTLMHTGSRRSRGGRLSTSAKLGVCGAECQSFLAFSVSCLVFFRLWPGAKHQTPNAKH